MYYHASPVKNIEIWGVKDKMLEELGISAGTAIIILVVLYFVIKCAVKNGIKEAWISITDKKVPEDLESEALLKEEKKRIKLD